MKEKDPEVRNIMLAHIATWQKSEQTQKAYCIEHNIAYHVFHYWYRVHRMVNRKKARNQKSSPAFVQLKVKPAPLFSGHAELILPDDYSTDSITEFPRQRSTRFHAKGVQDRLNPFYQNIRFRGENQIIP